MYAQPQQWSQLKPAIYDATRGGSFNREARFLSFEQPGNVPSGSSSSNMYNSAMRPAGGPIPMTESSSMRDSQLTKDSDESSLPYLQPDPEPVMPEPRPAIPPREPTTRTTPPPFPRVIPPSLSSFQAPSSPSSPEYMGPPRNYHPEALAIVGGYPPIKQGGPAPYPVMMMQPGGPPGRASMPVEQVMAKYGQALLPDEQYRPPEKFRPMSSPAPPSRNKLQRPSARRTRSDIPNPLSPNGEQTPSVTGDPFSLRTDPPIEQQQPQSPELSKRPASMPRKLTKKRPASAQAMGSESPQFPQERFDPLPDVLFHVRATQDYEMQAYDELSFATGAVLAVKSTHENGRWFGYVVGSSEKPQEGVFHRTYVNILQRMDSSKTKGNILLNAVAIRNYNATREDEFNFFAGDIISVISTPAGPFWVGFNQRAPSRGKLFPWKLVAPL